jgi:hypothetical protein
VVHRVAEGDATLRIGEGERPSSAVVTEGARPAHGVVLGGQLVPRAEPARCHQHLIHPGRLLLSRRRDGLRAEQPHAVHLADQCRVRPSQGARCADAVRGRQFRGLHLGGVEVDRGRVRDRVRPVTEGVRVAPGGDLFAEFFGDRLRGQGREVDVRLSAFGFRYAMRLTR